VLSNQVRYRARSPGLGVNGKFSDTQCKWNQILGPNAFEIKPFALSRLWFILFINMRMYQPLLFIQRLHHTGHSHRRDVFQ